VKVRPRRQGRTRLQIRTISNCRLPVAGEAFTEQSASVPASSQCSTIQFIVFKVAPTLDSSTSHSAAAGWRTSNKSIRLPLRACNKNQTGLGRFSFIDLDPTEQRRFEHVQTAKHWATTQERSVCDVILATLPPPPCRSWTRPRAAMRVRLRCLPLAARPSRRGQSRRGGRSSGN
jgi:hypothetical protein